MRPPRSVAERIYTDIRRWSVMPEGGRFAALEQPEALARESPGVFQASPVILSAQSKVSLNFNHPCISTTFS